MGASHATGLNHTGVTVSDLDRTIRYFRDGLGLPVSDPVSHSGEMFEQITGVEGCVIDICYVTLPHQTIELLSYSSPDGRATSTLRPCDSGHLHLCLNVDDIEAAIAAGRRYGFESLGPVQTVPDGDLAGTRVVYTKGPDGLVIELMEPPVVAP